MPITLEQKLDIRRLAPNRWRVVCLVGRAIAFYGEATSETPTFTATNEFAQGDIGKWRAVDQNRHLIVGFGGKATVSPKEGGQPNEVQVTFDGIAVVL
jgi:hypothetical protein